MSERVKIPIPESTFPTRIEVYHDGELNRHGGVQAGQTEASIKLPAPLQECEIRIIPCDAQGKPVGRGHVYKDESLQPEPPANIEPPVEPDDEPGEDGEGDSVASEVVADSVSSVLVERAEVDEPADEDVDEEDEDEDFEDFEDEDFEDNEDEDFE